MGMFNSMSDLIADADDLVAAMSNSGNPDIQALSGQVSKSVDEMRRIFRSRLKASAAQGYRHPLARLAACESCSAIAGVALGTALLVWALALRPSKLSRRNPRKV